MRIKDVSGIVHDLDPAKLFVSAPSASDCARNPDLDPHVARVLRRADLEVVCAVSRDVMESIYVEQRKLLSEQQQPGRGEGDGIRADPAWDGFSRAAHSGIKGRRGR